MTNALVSIVGPTAIGKTRLAIQVARAFKTEIISADSRQFYKEMCIGTAVPTKEELSAVKHHFIQHRSIMEPYSVGDFERDAIARLTQLFKVFPVVVMVGGSGLYVDAVAQGLDAFPKVDAAIRQQLNAQFKTQGIAPLQQQLAQLDPEYYKQVDLNNPHRLIRALEICMGAQKPYSGFLNRRTVKRNFKTVYIGIRADRQVIYDRINARVDQMMDDGLLDEVRALLPYQHLNALQTVGYKELFQYLNGACDKEKAIAEIKKNTRRFAKRQLTWFKRNDQIRWVDLHYDLEDVLQGLQQTLKDFNSDR